MPVKTGKDNKGCFAMWGDSGTKYYHTCGDEKAMGKAKQKATLQGIAMGDMIQNADTKEADEEEMRRIKQMHLIKQVDIKENVPNTFSAVTEAAIDSGNCIISGVCLFGRKESDNNRIYSDNAINSIVKLSEGGKCFINHITKDEEKNRGGVRDLRDWVGCFEGSRRDGDKVVSNLRVREAYWDLVRDIALMGPHGIGHSIDARVKVFQDDAGRESIADVVSLRSTDLVSSAATTSNLFEAAILENKDDDLDFFKQIITLKSTVEAKFDAEFIKEGLIQNEMDKQKIKSEIWKVMDYAHSLLYKTIEDYEMTIDEKKQKVVAIFDDLDAEVKKRISLIKDDYKEEKKPMNLLELKKDTELFESLKNELISEMKESEEVIKIKAEHTQLKESNTSLEKSVLDKDAEITQLKESNTKLEAEKKEMASELDKIKVAEAVAKRESMIKSIIAEAKLPKEATTDLWMEDLMSLQEKKDGDKVVTVEEQVKKRVEERKALSAGKGRVVNSGEEFTTAMQESNQPKQTEDALNMFVKALK